MAVDPVPWFIGGGAQHSPEVARLLAFAAFRGNEGIIEPDALKVQALAVPGPQVRVLPGACSILNRAAGGQYQAYAARVTSEEPLNVAATGSAGGRSDLVVMRVEDPYMPGEPWQDPADPIVGPYVFPRLIAGVPAGTKTVTGLGLGYSAIPLARIDLPASTGTIDAAKIVDLRKLANPRRERRVDAIFPGSVTKIQSAAYSTLGTSVPMDVPAWATQAKVVVTISALALIPSGTGAAAGAAGTLRAQVGTGASAVYTQNTTYDENATPTGGFLRTTYVTAGELAIPAALRGTVVSVYPQGNRTANNGYLQSDTGTTITVDVEWLEVPE